MAKKRKRRNDAIYDTTSDIPFDGDAREYLLAYARCRLTFYKRKHEWSVTRYGPNDKFYAVRSETWQRCVEWLEQDLKARKSGEGSPR